MKTIWRSLPPNEAKDKDKAKRRKKEKKEKERKKKRKHKHHKKRKHGRGAHSRTCMRCWPAQGCGRGRGTCLVDIPAACRYDACI